MREHSPFVTITINVAIGWLFEDGYAKEAARYFETAGNSFRTMLKKPPYRCMLKYQDKRGMLPTLQSVPMFLLTSLQTPRRAFHPILPGFLQSCPAGFQDHNLHP